MVRPIDTPASAARASGFVVQTRKKRREKRRRLKRAFIFGRKLTLDDLRAMIGEMGKLTEGGY